MTFTHRLTPEEAARVKPYTLMLEALLDSMIALLDENTVKLQGALKQYNVDMARYFGKALMSFEVDPAVAQGG
jgi:hypothetical protein